MPSQPPTSCGTLLQTLMTMPMADRVKVFGSCATDKQNPVDVDIWLDFRDQALEDFRSSKGFAHVRDILDLAHRHIGSLDPFIRFRDDVLVVRNDDATGWTKAKNARGIVKSMDQSSCSLEQALAWRESNRSALKQKMEEAFSLIDSIGVNKTMYECESLVAQGADAHWISPDFRQGIFYAAIHQKSDPMIRAMAALPAATHGTLGVSVLMNACAWGKIDILQAILDAGVPLHTAGDKGITPLHKAAQKGQTEACRFLLRHGADLHAPADNGWNALFMAAGEGHQETCFLLIAQGADAHQKLKGKTLWGHASAKGHDSVAANIKAFLAGRAAEMAIQDAWKNAGVAP